jgi:hypothetical protein
MITKRDLLNYQYDYRSEEPYTTFMEAIDNNLHCISKIEFTELEIISHIDGENDGNYWHWLCRLDGDNNKLLYIYGCCDYTGWGCQSSADSFGPFKPEELLLYVPEFDNNNVGVREQFIKCLYIHNFDKLLKTDE